MRILHYQTKSGSHNKDNTKGSLTIIAGCFCWSCFIILQAFLLKSYPAELSLASLRCMISSVEGIILAFAVESGNTAIWSLQFDAKLLTVVYGGFVSCTSYFLMGWLVKKKGPVFVSSFNPLGTVIIAILGSLFLAEQLYIGRIVGAAVIVIGLYMVLWGRSNDQRQLISHINQDAVSDQQMACVNGNIENTSN